MFHNQAGGGTSLLARFIRLLDQQWPVQDRPATVTTLVNLATRTPTLIAFIPANDHDAIYIGHSLTIYPSDPANTLPFGDRVIALVGDDPTCVQPLVLSNTFFQRVGTIPCKRTNHIIGVEHAIRRHCEHS